MRPFVPEFVRLQNKEARLNGFRDHGHMWRQKVNKSVLGEKSPEH